MSWLTKANRRVAAVTALVGFAVLAGSTASWAYWTSQATVQVTVNSADLTVTTANFSSLAKTFANSSLVSTGSVTVTNSTAGTSAQQGKVNLTFSGTGGDPYRSNFTFVVWLSTAANPCTDAATPGATLASGLWSSSASYVTPNGSGFAVGESRTYCVRTTAAPATTNWPANGAVSFTPQISAVIALGNYGGSASATTTQQTQYIYPLVTPPSSATTWNYIHRVFTTPVGNYCTDLEGGPGPNAIGWPCKNGGTANQSYRFDAVAGKAGYYTIKSNNTAGLVLQQNATGAAVTAVTAVTGTAAQQWTLQQTPTSYVGTVSRTFYQFVNASTGQCLTYAAVNGTTAALNQMAMANCDGTASQQFLVVRTMFSGVQGATDTVSCAYANPTFTISLSAATPNMRYELRVGGTSVANVTTNASGVGTLTRTYTAAATGTFEIYEASGAAADPGTLVATGTFTKGGTAGSATNACTVTGMGT